MKLELSSFDNNSDIFKFYKILQKSDFFLNNQQRNPFK